MVFAGGIREAGRTVDIEGIRAEFPILGRKIYGRELAYLDNAATTQKPRAVIRKLTEIYENSNGNPHRGAHYLGERATEELEKAREKVRSFINAPDASEIIFTRGATESINLAAYCFSESGIRPGDEVLITEMEHHSNIVPWQACCGKKNAELRVVPVSESGELRFEELKAMISKKTKIIALTHMSNVLGCVNPVKEIIDIAHENKIPVLVDAAQSVKHIPVDVRDMGCDFLVFSGHKLYAPPGIGVLFGKKELLEKMPPYQYGSAMIDRVSFDKTTYAGLPFKYEAGTVDYPGAASLGAAIDCLEGFGLSEIRAHENRVYEYAVKELRKVPGLRIYGDSDCMRGAVSFNLEGVHPYDTGAILDNLGIAVRTGHHCAEPLMERLGVPGTVRASFAVYNTPGEVDRLAEGARRAGKMLGV